MMCKDRSLCSETVTSLFDTALYLTVSFQKHMIVYAAADTSYDMYYTFVYILM
jgi:hypothetical protein